jgi:hypothetical protein
MLTPLTYSTFDGNFLLFLRVGLNFLIFLFCRVVLRLRPHFPAAKAWLPDT